MTLPKNFKLAALASAAMPSVAVAGVRESGQDSATDDRMGITHAVVQDASGRCYDVFASDEDAGRKRLRQRAKAARTLERSREVGGLGFALDRALAFRDAGEKSPTGDYAVLVTPYAEGEARQLDLLTLEDASSVGTAIGAIHRQRSSFLTENHYSAFTTGQIRAQLTGWIQRLQQAGHIPPAITSSWAQVIETEGLWSFSTCLVHGGFQDGDFIFSGSSITEVSNWQNMQINDPARDLAWMFAKMDEPHRSALMGSYGRMMGSRIDDLIMLRANLWLQMEQVGEFIEALNQADNTKIMRFKAQVEHLAHQLTVVTNRATSASSATIAATVAHQNAAANSNDENDDTNASNPLGSSDSGELFADDATGETDRTGSAEVLRNQPSDSTESHPVAASSAKASRPYPDMPSPSSSATMVLTQAGKDSINDASSDSSSELGGQGHDEKEHADSAAPTMLIPLLERQERALHDAQIGLEEYEEHEHEQAEHHDDLDSKADAEASDEALEDSTGEAEVAVQMSMAIPETDDEGDADDATNDGLGDDASDSDSEGNTLKDETARDGDATADESDGTIDDDSSEDIDEAESKIDDTSDDDDSDADAEDDGKKQSSASDQS
ncbi:phosphotransferase [Bifidobacterium sp. ESL0790]|uniref:phosphotransferase n=1 Tax=Bifidobacterium sp. ESL0790 TaxID=2983233 RepID=UPI0032AF362A